MWVLVNGSAGNEKASQPAFFVQTKQDAFEMHFCIEKLNQFNEYEYTWFMMPFKSDFVSMLQSYGRLPFTTIEESLKVAH